MPSLPIGGEDILVLATEVLPGDQEALHKIRHGKVELAPCLCPNRRYSDDATGEI